MDYRNAYLSSDGVYRYSLVRAWDLELPTVLFIMLNPSTADAMQDDPTIRRCVGYARDWGYGRLLVGNLFGFRATDPKDLIGPVDAVGPENDSWLRQMGDRADLIVAAWGINAMNGRLAVLNRPAAIKELFKGRLHLLKETQDGHPSHPVRLAKDLKPQFWC